MDRERIEIYRQAVVLMGVNGYDAVLHAAYSGRAMYGGTTPGISTEFPLTIVGWAITCAVVERGGDAEDAEEFIPERSDSMGLSTIVY